MAKATEADALDELEAYTRAIRTLRAYHLDKKRDGLAQWSFDKLAAEVGMDVTTLQRLVNGSRAMLDAPRRSLLVKWAAKKNGKKK